MARAREGKYIDNFFMSVAIKPKRGKIVCGWVQGNGGLIGAPFVGRVTAERTRRSYVLKQINKEIYRANKGEELSIYCENKFFCKVYTNGYDTLECPYYEIPFKMVDLRGAKVLKKIPTITLKEVLPSWRKREKERAKLEKKRTRYY